MFELLYQILHQNWRYFFKTSVLTSVQRGASEDTMENEAQFTAAMQVCVCMWLKLSPYTFLDRQTVIPLLFLTCAEITFPGFRTVFPAAWHPHLQAESFLFGVTEQQAQVVSQSKLSLYVNVFSFSRCSMSWSGVVNLLSKSDLRSCSLSSLQT